MIEHAQWIAPAGAEKYTPCHFKVEKTLTFDQRPETLLLQIACDGNYALSVNGQLVGRGPARGSRTVFFYDEYDIAPVLHVGENRISALCVCMNYPAEASLPITPAVRMAVGNITSDASWQSFLCLTEWRTDGPLFTRQSGYAEWRDLQKEAIAVETVMIPADSPLHQKSLLKRDIPMPLETVVLPVDIPVAAFVPACDLDSIEIAKFTTSEPHFPLPSGIEAQLVALVTGGEHDITLPVPENNGGVTMVIDFDKEVSGWTEVELTAGAGTVVDIAYEEELYGDRLRADHTHTNPSYQFTDRYILKEDRQKIGNLLMERGFRMIQITCRNLTSPVTLHAVRAIDRRYPFTRRGDFFCSDYQLNRLWETSAETLSACTTDVFTDCPWRERLFYCNDFFIENRTALKIFGDPRIHKRMLQMVFGQTRRDTLFPCNIPSMATESPEDGSIDFRIILSGDLTLALTLHEYYLHTGDLNTVKECLLPLRNMMQTFASWFDDRRVMIPPAKYWNFIDWSFELNGMDFSGKGTALMNFLYIIAARATNALCAAVNETEFTSEAELTAIREATVEVFYNREKGVFINTDSDPHASAAWLKILGIPPDEACNVTDTSRLVHALALLAGVDKKLCAAMNDETLLTPELYYNIFLLDAMEHGGSTADALKLIRTHWGKMLDSGTPTLWENGVHKIGKAGFGGSASLCHGFSSAPAAFLQTAVLGIRPTAPGFTRFAFAPLATGIGFAQGRVPTPYGTIRCKWEYANAKYSATLYVPENCTVSTPAGEFTAGNWSLEWKDTKI